MGNKKKISDSSAKPARDARDANAVARNEAIRGQEVLKKVKEHGGRKGPEPTRFGDWEKDGKCVDF